MIDGTNKLTADEKKYRAESDAYTLIQAEGIKSDTSRLKMALASVDKLKQSKEKEISTINKLTAKNYYSRNKK